MPGHKRKYNVRFPPRRIKKIMQKDTEVGRIASAVPVIIGFCLLGQFGLNSSSAASARALEMFLKSLLTKTCLITQSKLSSAVSVAHMKQCIESEKLFHFLKDLVEEATSAAAQKNDRGAGIWPLFRSKGQEGSGRKASEGGSAAPRRSLASLQSDSSSSESELYICL